MKRVAIEIDGVLRDTYAKIEHLYQKFFIDELELVDEDFQYEIKQPYNTDDYRNHFIFKTEEEYVSFIYEEFAMQIFGHAPSTTMSTFYDLKDLMYNLKENFEIILISEQVGKTKPATLFFISKFSCEADKIIFYNRKTIDKIWDEFDILVAASPTLLQNHNDKTTIKFETTYNSSIDVKTTITNLKELESTLIKL
jgi:hypothetical protein